MMYIMTKIYTATKIKTVETVQMEKCVSNNFKLKKRTNRIHTTSNNDGKIHRQ